MRAADLTLAEIGALTARIQAREQGQANRTKVIDASRREVAPALERIAVGVVPGMAGHMMGVVVAGRSADGHIYVLGDYSMAGDVVDCAERALAAYRDHMADVIAGMVNEAGDYLEKLLRLVNSAVQYKAIHAIRGLAVRAEPVFALYERGRVHHVGTFASLESRMSAWTVDTRGTEAQVSALVCAITELESRLLQDHGPSRLAATGPARSAPASGTWHLT